MHYCRWDALQLETAWWTHICRITTSYGVGVDTTRREGTTDITSSSLVVTVLFYEIPKAKSLHNVERTGSGLLGMPTTRVGLREEKKEKEPKLPKVFKTSTNGWWRSHVYLGYEVFSGPSNPWDSGSTLMWNLWENSGVGWWRVSDCFIY